MLDNVIWSHAYFLSVYVILFVFKSVFFLFNSRCKNKLCVDWLFTDSNSYNRKKRNPAPRPNLPILDYSNWLKNKQGHSVVKISRARIHEI